MRGIEWDFRCISQPRIPIDRGRRKIRRDRVLPRAIRVITAQSQLNQRQVPYCAVHVKFTGFPAQLTADALGPHLDNPIVVLGGGDHCNTVLRGMRHRLLAIDVLARTYCIHDDLAVPVIGHRRNDTIYLLVVEQVLISA